jgi:hypothetical protein
VFSEPVQTQKKKKVKVLKKMKIAAPVIQEPGTPLSC